MPSPSPVQMLQQSQQKLEPIAIMDMEEMEADHQQHTADAGPAEPQSAPLLVLASPEHLPPG